MPPTTTYRWLLVCVWLVGLLTLWALTWGSSILLEPPLLAPVVVALWAGVATHDHQHPLCPWCSGERWRRRHVGPTRWRRWLCHQRQRVQRMGYRLLWAVWLARLAFTGALTMASLVDWLTRTQLRRQLGALPVLYALLESLQVRQTIRRYCPSSAAVDHGTVALVLILNRLMAPRPLYKVADWVAQTVLVHTLGVPATKFNDDRLARTLDAIAPHAREIWLEIVHHALVQFEIDLHFLFYDLTAFVVHGAHNESNLVDYGFAHNTPSDKQKVKLGATATGDGYLPIEYAPWSGRTADLATVQQNMERVCRLLERHGYSLREVLVIGDRANLNDELALTYDANGLKYLAGLQPQKKAHRDLVVAFDEKQYYAHPLGEPGYFGLPCAVTFTHAGRSVTHRGLVVLSGPMRTSLRRERAARLRALRQDLAGVAAKIGQKRYRSVKEVQARADTCLRHSPVGHLMSAEAHPAEDGSVRLRWWVNRAALQSAMRADGRYLLVTNDAQLAPARMLELYRAKDGLEKRFTVTKHDLKVSPLYVHSDERIQAMLLLNMLALLVYSLLERQVRRQGLALTTRRIIEQLENVAVIETHCWDGSVLYRVTPMNSTQLRLLTILARVVAEVRWPCGQRLLPLAPATLEEGGHPPRVWLM